jgi:O-antigen ligase
MLIPILITIFSILFAVLAWKRLDWALALTVFALPAYLIRFQIGFLPMTLLEVMILILFIMFALQRIIKSERIRLSNYKWLGLFLLIASAVAVYLALDRVAALGLWKAYFVEPVLFFLVFINVVKKREHWNLIIKAIGLSALFVAIPAIVQKFTGWGIYTEFWFVEETRRVVSWYGFPNAIGLYLAPIAMLFAGLVMKRKVELFERWQKRKKLKFKWLDLFYVVVFVCSVFAIIYARSEGALIALVAGIILLGLLYPCKLSRLSTFVLLVLLVLVVLFVPAARDYTAEKFTLSDHSGQIRQAQWSETWEMLKDGKIVSGAGLSGYQTAVEPYHAEGIWIKDKNDPEWMSKIQESEEFRVQNWQPTEIYMYPHNVLLNFWSEIGLFGALFAFLLVVKFVINYLRVISRENRKIYIILICVMAVILIHGLVDVPYFKNDLAVFWWMLFGLSAVLINKKVSI